MAGTECGECGGSAVVGNRCIAHLTPRERDTYADQVRSEGIIDGAGARGVKPWFLALLFSAAAESEVGQVGVLLLDGARIEGNLDVVLPVRHYASFVDCEFGGDLEMRIETRAPISFANAKFRGSAVFTGTVGHTVSFAGAQFGGPISFIDGVVGGHAVFRKSRFATSADFSGLGVGLGLELSSSTVPGEFIWSEGRSGFDEGEADELEALILAEDDSWWQGLPSGFLSDSVPRLRVRQKSLLEDKIVTGARIDHIVFDSRAYFDHVEISGEQCALQDVRFRDVFDFREAKLRASHVLIRTSQFDQRLSVSAECTALDCVSNTFSQGADLEFDATTAAIEDCRFASASPIRGRLREGIPSPRLLSLRRTDCVNLRLVNLDLAPCRFAETHNLDHLAVEGRLQLAETPPPRRAAARKLIAEEWELRNGKYGWDMPRDAEWHDAGEGRAASLVKPPPLKEPDIAALYRALRKGSEDAKDEPGAADFYYGEMEMRRKAPTSPQRIILWAYWMLSGYALRPWRTIAALLATILLFAFLFQTWGFRERPAQLKPVATTSKGAARYELRRPAKGNAAEQYIDAVTYTAGTATAVLSGPDRPLKRSGSVMRIVLRILGPVLIALLVLSIRGRVKR